MIIDTHTHIWSSMDQLGREVADRLRQFKTERFGQFEAGPAFHERDMTSVDASLVLGFRSERLGARVPNELIADFVGRDPRKRIGIAGIDPMSDDCLDQVDRAVELGLVGVTVSPACQGFHPLHSSAMRIYDRCAELAMPVLIQNLDPLTPSAVLEFARPMLWDEVARSFPSLRLVIGQLGFPWSDETLVLVGKHPNVYSDISGIASRPWQLYTAMLNASAMGVMDKLLFGSGFPYESPARVIEALYSLNVYSHGTQLPSIPRSQIRGIVERESLACLGIEVEMPTRRADAAMAGMDMDLPAVEMGQMLERRRTSIPGMRSAARRPS